MRPCHTPSAIRHTPTLRALLWWAILIVLAAAPSRGGSAETEVVARVNGEPVTRAELQRLLADPTHRPQLQQELGVQEPDRKDLERVALRKLINRRLLLQEAGRRNFTVTEQEVNRAVATFRRRLKNPRRYAAWMKFSGLDEKSLREAIRINLLTTRVRAAVMNEVRLSEEEIQAYYAAHQADLQTAEEVRLRTIAVTDKAAAEEILAALKSGEAFERLARERSLESHAAQGGDRGWVSAKTLAQPLREAVGTLKAGETGGPLQIGAEFLLVRLEERRPARTKSLAEAQPEIERRLLAAKQREALQAWLAEQEKKSKIEVFL